MNVTTVISPDDLALAFARNLRVLNRQLDGLSHEESLLQLPFRGNCLNWVLGHLATSRDQVLRALGEPPLLTPEETVRYETGSEPVGPGGEAAPLERLRAVLAQGQAILQARLPAALAEAPAGAAAEVFGLYFHESYHLGQTELLRQLAGRGDKVI
jgi:hypothetical protein